MDFSNKNYWALILGGSSGFGLASAKKLSKHGMNICIVHRDRRGAMSRIEPEFESIRSSGVAFKSFNLDALSDQGRTEVIEGLQGVLKGGGVRLLLHSIAFGSVKLIAPEATRDENSPAEILAQKLGLDSEIVQQAADSLFAEGNPRFSELASPPAYESELLLGEEDLATTIYAMGSSLLSWTSDLFANKLFTDDARVIGLTSEGNELAWKGYAAVGAAKCALESVSRSIAKEFAPYGIRSNIVQPGVTDTPALRLIPGNAHLSAGAIKKNPFGRLTQVEDVANVITLLATDEAAWINGSLIRVDGGERISG